MNGDFNELVDVPDKDKIIKKYCVIVIYLSIKKINYQIYYHVKGLKLQSINSIR